MTRNQPAELIYGQPTSKLAALAKEAVREAIRETVQAGHPVTGELDGVVVTLQAEDPRFAHLRANAKE
jgi:hypothetical protein